jgi:hypothetical protein
MDAQLVEDPLLVGRQRSSVPRELVGMAVAIVHSLDAMRVPRRFGAGQGPSRPGSVRSIVLRL